MFELYQDLCYPALMMKNKYNKYKPGDLLEMHISIGASQEDWKTEILLVCEDLKYRFKCYNLNKSKIDFVEKYKILNKDRRFKFKRISSLPK